MRRYTPYEDRIIERRCHDALVSLFRTALIVILLAGALSMLLSCGSSRKMESSSLNIEEKDSTREEVSILTGTSVQLTDLVKTDVGIKFDWVRYDTDKQPDEEGRYPVLEEGSGEMEISQEGEHTEVRKDSASVSASKENSSKKNVRSTTSEESEKVGVFSDLTEMFKALALFVGVLLVSFILKKVFKF